VAPRSPPVAGEAFEPLVNFMACPVPA
jgi:hypothetical protein